MSSLDPNFAERGRAILQEMAEIGLGLAYKVGAERENLGEASLAFQRVAKAVRQTIAFEARVAEGDLKARQRQEAEHRVGEVQVRKARVSERADEIEDRVGAVIEKLTDRVDWNEDDEVDPLLDELGEILGYYTADGDFLDRPIDDIIADICKEMDIPVPDLPRAVGEVDRRDSAETEGVETPFNFPLIPAKAGTQADREFRPAASDSS